MLDRYVVLITTSPSLDRATLELASRLASRANAVLVFLHVIPLRASAGEGMLHAAHDLAGGQIERWHGELRPTEAGTRFRHLIEAGEPDDVVVAFCERAAVELLVVEEPPRGRFFAALGRGVAERLIRRVDCPVVVNGPRQLREPMQAVRYPSRSPSHPSDLADLLSAVVDARVASVVRWMDQCAEAAERIASSDAVHAALQLDLGRSGGVVTARRIEHSLHVELTEHQLAQRALAWRLDSPTRQRGNLESRVAPCDALDEFYARLSERGHTTSVPLAVEGEAGLVVLCGARVDDDRHPDSTLLFLFDAADDFLRILGQPGSEPSLETYAFDRTGLMLSTSRFPDHLRDAGLLPDDDQQTPLRIRVAEPSAGPADAWPLTRMARAATRHEDGVDLHPYPDYRGIDVVGAWRWVEAYGFGVTAEIDA